MAVLKMKRIDICALKTHRKAILERLQELGWMEIDLNMEDKDTYEIMDTAGAKSEFQKNMHLAENALKVLDEYAPTKQEVFASLKGKPVLDGDIYDVVANKRQEYLSIANSLVDMDKKIANEKGKIQKLYNEKEEIFPWLNLDVAMDFKGSKHTKFFVGTIPKLISQTDLEKEVAQANSDLSAYSINIISQTKDMSYVAILAINEEATKLEEVLWEMGFARPSKLVSFIPKDYEKFLDDEIVQCSKKIEELIKKINEFKDKRKTLCMLSDYYRVRTDKYDVLGKLPQTKRTFAISGYIPQKVSNKLSSEMEDKYNAIVNVSDIKEGEDAPVVLNNDKLGSIGEDVVSSFGLPHKGEIDPSSIMMVFYVFLFGLMLSDAAYGAVVSLICGVVIKKFPRMDIHMKKLFKLFFLCGLSTIFWGVMFGGYFGNVVDTVATTFFGVTLKAGQTLTPALWFAPLNDPMKMLMYAMLFGCIHLFTGLGIKGYTCIKNKDYMSFFVDVVCWFMFVLGLIFILLPTDLFKSISQMTFNFPPFVALLSKGAAIFGALGILFFSGRGRKNVGVRLALGAYDLYNVTGWLSDILSYSRLLALGLATGVIANVVNQMGSLVGGSVLGAILFVIIFIVGHSFNIAINLLGAYVHTCRLQYVEFFGKFYEGGGKEFKPFNADTKYVDIEGGKK